VPPRRPLIWPWLLLLLLLVAGGIAAAFFLTRDTGPTTRVPDVVGLQVAVAVRDLGERGYTADVEARASSKTAARIFMPPLCAARLIRLAALRAAGPS
jgi:uncharacterized protein (UPF0333 family)